MAVAPDANATASVTANGVTAINSSNLTVGAGSNRALVVQFAVQVQGITAVTCVWDTAGTNQSCTLIKTDNATITTGRADLFGLVAPTSGALNVRVSWTTASGEVYLNHSSYTGVDQTGGVTSFPHAVSAKGTASPTVTITSAVGNYTVAAGASNTNWSAPTKTQLFINNTGGTTVAAGSQATGAATVVHAFTSSGSWVLVGTDLLASGGAAAVFVPYQPQYARGPVMAQ
jgi:hypothetical protein